MREELHALSKFSFILNCLLGGPSIHVIFIIISPSGAPRPGGGRKAFHCLRVRCRLCASHWLCRTVCTAFPGTYLLLAIGNARFMTSMRGIEQGVISAHLDLQFMSHLKSASSEFAIHIFLY